MEVNFSVLLISSRATDKLKAEAFFSLYRVPCRFVLLNTQKQLVYLLKLYRRSGYELPNVVIMDIDKPFHPSLDLITFLRRCPLTATSPLIVYSQFDWPWLVEEAMLEGADAFMTKPVDWQKVLTKAVDLAGVRSPLIKVDFLN